MDDLNFDSSTQVQLYIYDLTQGMSAMMSQMLLGRHIEGIWHTAIVVFGKEFFYGSQGIQSCEPGGTVLRQPNKVEIIGETFIPFQVFKEYIRGLAESSFRGVNYNLLQHNCNTFSEVVCQFLCSCSIPKYILDLPQEILSTPFGQTLAPLISQISGNQTGSFSYEPQVGARESSPGYDQLNDEIEAARLQSLALDEKRNELQQKILKKERKKQKRQQRNSESTSSIAAASESSNCIEIMSETGEVNGSAAVAAIPSEMLPSEQVLEDEARERKEEEERKRNRDPPIVFRSIDPKVELEALVKLVDGQLAKEEEQSIEELHQYLIEGEGSWALGDNFLVFVGRILRDSNISTETRVHLMRALSDAALKDDIILLLHQDRRDHVLMNYAQDIDRLKPEEQQALALFMCNLFENLSSSEWLLYISEWSYNGTQTSNIRASTKVAVHCLLAGCPTLQDLGTAIIHNLACKEVKTVVFDDVAVELAMALLQFFNTKPDEEQLFRTMKALSKFVQVSPDVPQLVQMIGPHPKEFKGASGRIDDLIDQISKKVR